MSHGPLAKITKELGRNTLSVRVLRDRGGWICERQLIEGKAPGQVERTQVLAFRSLHTLRHFLEHDPYFAQIRRDVERLLAKVASEVGHGH